VALAATALTLGTAACGGDDDDDSAAGRAEPATTQTGTPVPSEEGGLKLTASEQGGLKFEPGSLSAKAGEITITMTNPDGNNLPHDIALEGDGVNETGEVVQPGGTSEVKATVKPGTYTFFCSVGSHRQNGMEGTLTVE
jgi:plastocyanin